MSEVGYLEIYKTKSKPSGNGIQMSSTCTPPRASKTVDRSHIKEDPPSAHEEFLRYRRQRLEDDAKKNSTKIYSAIRFSKELEVYSKQPTNHCSDTHMKSILRNKSGNHKVSGNQPKRRNDTLLEKLKETLQVENDIVSSGKPELTGPVLPRQDWNINSLFPTLKDHKQKNKRSVFKSQRIRPSTILARIPKNEQFYSSEYLLKKYAATSNDSPSVNLDSLEDRLDIGDLPFTSSKRAGIEVPSTPKGSADLRHRPFSDSKLNEKSITRRRLARQGDANRLSYLQLEDFNSKEETIDSNDPRSRIGDQLHRKGFEMNSGYDLRSFVDRIPIDSPMPPTTSYDELLVQKSTSDTDNSHFGITSGPKQFDWDTISEDSTLHFDEKDFRISDSKRPRGAYKAWSVWVLVGTVFICLASTVLVYSTMIDKGGGLSTSTAYFGMGECANHDRSNRTFKSDRYDAIRRFLLFQPVKAIDQPGSPQREALCWISEFDDYYIDVIDDNEAAIIQRYSLAVIYFSTIDQTKSYDNNSGSLKNTDFLSAQHECDWDAIICNHSREVTILRLSNKSLSGKIPQEIGDLTSLNFIDLSVNYLTGSIPISIAQLTYLEYLALAFNEFKTTIPTSFGQIASLKTLNLRSSQILQQIPSNLGYLSKLELLLLDDNSLSGTIPRELGSLIHAEQIDFRKNDLSGTVPTELCGLRSNGTLKELAADEWVFCDCCT